MTEISELTESKSFWCLKLIDTVAPSIVLKFQQIFEEAYMISNETKETRLYLKAFQNALSFIPEWSNTIIQKECQDIITRSKCPHLKELIAAVHVLALKIVTNMRTNNKSKSVHINIPDVEVFVHKSYINAARQIWKTVFLYSREVDLIEKQKNNYEIEKIIRAAVYHTILDNIPAEKFLNSYLAEDVEEEEDVIIEPMEPVEPEPEPEPLLITNPLSGSTATSATATAAPNTSFNIENEVQLDNADSVVRWGANNSIELSDMGDLDLGLDATLSMDPGASAAAAKDSDPFDLDIEQFN